MLFDWNDYSADSDTENVSLLLSFRSQSLILAAMEALQSRFNWVETDDSTWDDIDAAVGEAFEEIIEIVMTDGTPVGAIVMFMGEVSEVPEKWLIADGASLPLLDYPDLALVMHGWRSGDFIILPDMRDRFVYGASFNADVGDTGGAATHTLSVAEMPVHSHLQRGRNSPGGSSFQSNINVSISADTPVNTITTTGNAGSGAAHNNMPPYIRGFWIIKVLP